MVIDRDAAAAVAVDIRFLRQEEPQPSGSTIRSITVSVRINGDAADRRANGWRTLQSASWPDGVDWPDQAFVDDPSVEVHAQPAQISRFTPPYWVQFLPSAASLLPADAELDI